MNEIHGEPNTYDFGLTFNYAVWDKDTVITLANVPWNNDYRDIVRFPDRAALNAYIDSQASINGIKIDNASTAPVNRPVRIDVPFTAAYKYNYLRATNGAGPIPGNMQRDYYYFITDVRYIAPNTTEVVVQLDVWQTFGYEVTFGNCYIDRGHIGIANEKAFDNYGRDYLAVPEGLDVGSEMQIVWKERERVMSPWGNPGYNVLVCSTQQLDAASGTIDDPRIVTAKGSMIQGLPSGANFYVFLNVNTFKQFMEANAEKPWVTQGIVSITLIPQVQRYYDQFIYDNTGPDYSALAPTQMGRSMTRVMKENWREAGEIINNIPGRYQHLKKFLTFPYTAIELTTWSATPIILKPESWNDPNATVTEEVSLLPPYQRVIFWPQRYNASGTRGIEARADYGTGLNYGVGDDNGEFVDISTIIANFPQMALVNNSGIAYMASNANSLAFQNRAADWSQQRAMGSNQLSYDQASAGMQLATELTGIGRVADIMGTNIGNTSNILHTATSAIGNLVGGGASGAISGGAAGAAAGPGGAAAGAAGGAAMGVLGGVVGGITSAINTGIGVSGANANLGVRSAQALSSNRAQNSNAAYVRDTNKSLADWAARGDYETTIAGINAKVQDAQLTQPTTVGQMGGEAMNMIHDRVELSMRWKMIDPSAMRTIGEYWLRYGYAVRQFGRVPADFMVMQKFTYWKLSETYIQAAPMPETFKQAIRGIFEKGVTVWRSPSDIGNIDIADNAPLEGITL